MWRRVLNFHHFRNEELLLGMNRTCAPILSSTQDASMHKCKWSHPALATGLMPLRAVSRWRRSELVIIKMIVCPFVSVSSISRCNWLSLERQLHSKRDRYGSIDTFIEIHASKLFDWATNSTTNKDYETFKHWWSYCDKYTPMIYFST